jgi:hypothetical protein
VGEEELCSGEVRSDLMLRFRESIGGEVWTEVWEGK